MKLVRFPRIVALALPSSITKHSRPRSPWRIKTFPAGTSISVVIRAICCRSLLLQLENSWSCENRSTFGSRDHFRPGRFIGASISLPYCRWHSVTTVRTDNAELCSVTFSAASVPNSGPVESSGVGEFTLLHRPAPWNEGDFEQLGALYWHYVVRGSRNLIRVRARASGAIGVSLFGIVPLLRLGPAEIVSGPDAGEVLWRVRGGALVARSGRDSGYFRIRVEHLNGVDSPGGTRRVSVALDLADYHPRLRGSGALARAGVKVYSASQMRFHRCVTHGFLKSLTSWQGFRPQGRPPASNSAAR